MKQQQQKSEDHYNLHSLHKSSVSKITKIKPLSALGPSGTPQPKVYKVKPIHFRELVQKLTGAQPDLLQQQHPMTQSQPRPQPQPQPRPRRSNLQAVAPPPLPLHPHQLQLNTQSDVTCKVEQDQKTFSEKTMPNGVGTNELILSPNFQAWFSFAMLSPGSAALSQM